MKQKEKFTSFKPAEDALHQLKIALEIKTPTEIERDGIIQRFEYCYEIMWKLSQRILKENEIESDSPKSVFRELGRLGWINNVEDWIEFQKSRNETSHEYGKKFATKSHELAKLFYPIAVVLLEILKKKSE